jgi:hypothetical protein
MNARWAAVLLLAGCTPIGAASADEFRSLHASFLDDEGLAREAVVVRLGPPTHQYEGGRIVCWRLLLSQKEVVTPVPAGPTDELLEEILRRRGEFGVVLVCTPDGRVTQRRLFKVIP